MEYSREKPSSFWSANLQPIKQKKNLTWCFSFIIFFSLSFLFWAIINVSIWIYLFLVLSTFPLAFKVTEHQISKYKWSILVRIFWFKFKMYVLAIIFFKDTLLTQILTLRVLYTWHNDRISLLRRLLIMEKLELLSDV